MIKLISFFVFALLPLSVANAASDYLLKLGGVEGETTKASTGGVTEMGVLSTTPTSSPTVAPINTVTNPLYQDKGVAGTNPLYESDKAKVTPPPPPPRPPAGDPDFDLLKVAPPPPPRPPAGDPDFDLLKTAPPTGESGKVNVAAGDVNGDGKSGASAKGNVEYGWKVEEGESAVRGDPDFDLLNIHFDEDDDGDTVPTKDEDVSAQKKVSVRGWDPKKKEEVIAHPELVHTPDDLRMYTEVTTLESEEITGVKMDKSSLDVESSAEGKLLWFIPVTMPAHVIVKFELADSTSDPVHVKLPWWSIFVKKSAPPSDIEDAIATELAAMPWEKVDNSETPMIFAQVSHTLKSVSNVLKTKHDTVKNSIGNIR